MGRAGFEIVQCHFESWRFAAADCTAAFGLHGALVVGDPVMLDDAARDRLVDELTRANVTLRRGNDVVDTGVSSVVLDSPACALAHLCAASTIKARPSSEGGSSPAT